MERAGLSAHKITYGSPAADVTNDKLEMEKDQMEDRKQLMADNNLERKVKAWQKRRYLAEDYFQQ